MCDGRNEFPRSSDLVYRSMSLLETEESLMSCWVVPSVAAELWGCSVEKVMDAISSGSVPTKEEAGWTFIDVAPDSPKLITPKSVRPPTPDTFAIVSEAESMALAGAGSSGSDSTADMEGDWRKIRETVAESRRARLPGGVRTALRRSSLCPALAPGRGI
jgi:hypothetical protein